MHSSAPASDPVTKPRLVELLDRPASERLREFKYRFAQSAVFGLPALALQIWGRALGGAEAMRWVGVLQALLVGWVVYVAAAGMAFEGLLLLPRRKLSVDLLPAVAAIGGYLVAFVQLLMVLAGSRPHVPPIFAIPAVLLMAWCGLRWAWLAGTQRGAQR